MAAPSCALRPATARHSPRIRSVAVAGRCPPLPARCGDRARSRSGAGSAAAGRAGQAAAGQCGQDRPGRQCPGLRGAGAARPDQHAGSARRPRGRIGQAPAGGRIVEAGPGSGTAIAGPAIRCRPAAPGLPRGQPGPGSPVDPEHASTARGPAGHEPPVLGAGRRSGRSRALAPRRPAEITRHVPPPASRTGPADRKAISHPPHDDDRELHRRPGRSPNRWRTPSPGTSRPQPGAQRARRRNGRRRGRRAVPARQRRACGRQAPAAAIRNRIRWPTATS